VTGILAPATAAAREGPFWKICENVGANNGTFEDTECKKPGGTKAWESVRLPEGGSKEIVGKAGLAFVIEAGGIVVECTKLKLQEGKARINGSNGRNFSSMEVGFVLESCVVKGNGEGCEVEGKKVASEGLIDTLTFGALKLAAGDILLAWYKPLKGEVLARLKFAAKLCKVKEAALEGSVAGEGWQGKGPIEIENHELLSTITSVNFPATPVAVVFWEFEKVKTEAKPSLKLFGVAAKLRGRAELELIGGQSWGIFS
jgi:hypothetical protein